MTKRLWIRRREGNKEIIDLSGLPNRYKVRFAFDYDTRLMPLRAVITEPEPELLLLQLARRTRVIGLQMECEAQEFENDYGWVVTDGSDMRWQCIAHADLPLLHPVPLGFAFRADVSFRYERDNKNPRNSGYYLAAECKVEPFYKLLCRGMENPC